MSRPLSNTLGIDDGPFRLEDKEPVFVAAPVFSRTRMDGLLTCSISQDGEDATDCLVEMIASSRFLHHIQLILLGGVTLGGFNVVDVFELSRRTERPVLVVVRKEPDEEAMDAALENLAGSQRKRELLRDSPTMQQVGSLWVQTVGLSLEDAASTLRSITLHGNFPEPLRVAHLIAGGVVRGESRGRG